LPGAFATGLPQGSYFPTGASQDFKMEAERLNAISNTLTDLDARSAELRRYL
jgi:hypothetical protein